MLELAMRIATSPSERWLTKAAEWNPEFSSKYRTNRAIERHQGKDMTSTNEEETENLTERSNQINKTWRSTQQKTAEDGLYSKKITQLTQSNRWRSSIEDFFGWQFRVAELEDPHTHSWR